MAQSVIGGSGGRTLLDLPSEELTLDPERQFVVIRSGSRRGHFVDKYLYG